MRERSVRLNDDEMLDVVIIDPPANKDSFTTSGMERVPELGF